MNTVNMANMANMAPMGGPVGAPMGMMNNGGVMAPQQIVPPRPQQGGDSADARSRLNTYIYEYFLRTNMVDCAKAILKSADGQIKLEPRRDEQGNIVGNGLGGDSMDVDSKEDIDSKSLEELPPAQVPTSLNDSCFLLEWFTIFWEMYQVNKGHKAATHGVNQFVSHAQQQHRMRQNQQQDMLRQINPERFANNQQFQMMRNMQNGQMMNMKQANHLPRTAMANSQANPQAMQMLQQKQAGQMSRDPSDMDGNRPRPSSPGSNDNAPSPSKRPRLDGGPFNPAQAGMMANGRPVGQGMPGQQVGAGPNNPQQVQQLLLDHNINPAAMNPDQLQTFTNQSPSVQAKTIATYAQNLSQHHNQHMPNKPMPNTSGPQAQGSPMVPQGPDVGAYYNAEMGPGGMRPGPGGQQAAGGSNHALQDYQMQLMLLEQQNKKRLMMARQEQDGIGMGRDGAPGPGGPGGPGGPPGGPNAPFQGTSPPGGRTGASPNPAEQMKRNAQQMSSGGMGSPIPEGQNRSSPNPVNFMAGNMDPNMAPNNFNMVAAAQMNGMRPPSSHPAQHFNGQMNQQQMMQARQQQAQAQAQAANGPQMQWQGPNGAPMGPGGPPGQPVQGTPQQRAMPPPSAPAAANAQRTATASPQVTNAAPPTPQQSTKANPKKKDNKNAKGKTATQKKSASNLNSGATPAADAAAEAEPPTPATPITPVNPQSFAKPGQAGAVVPNGQPVPAPPAPAVVPPPSIPDPSQNGNFMDGSGMDFVGGLDFANPLTTDNVLNDFDFDSFLHDDNQESGGFDFSNAAFGMEGGEIGAE